MLAYLNARAGSSKRADVDSRLVRGTDVANPKANGSLAHTATRAMTQEDHPMKQRTKKRAVMLVAALAAAFATAAAAQSTQPPREGGVYQYGDANRANGAANGQMPHNTDERRQSGYPQPGTAADATGSPAGPGGMQESGAQPAPGAATPGK